MLFLSIFYNTILAVYTVNQDKELGRISESLGFSTTENFLEKSKELIQGTTPEEISKYIEILEKEEAGDALKEAQFQIGLCQIHGEGVSEDVEDGLALIKQSLGIQSNEFAVALLVQLAPVALEGLKFLWQVSKEIREKRLRRAT